MADSNVSKGEHPQNSVFVCVCVFSIEQINHYMETYDIFATFNPKCHHTNQIWWFIRPSEALQLLSAAAEEMTSRLRSVSFVLSGLPFPETNSSPLKISFFGR